MDKSYVTMEKHICVVCGKEFDTGSLLMDKMLRQRFEMYTVTGVSICKECNKDGYIALIECDPEKSKPEGGIIKPENAWKTGVVVHVRKEAFQNIFNVPPPKGGFVFIDQEATKKLQSMVNKNGEKDEE